MEVYLHAYLLDPDLEAALSTNRIVALVESGAANLEEVGRRTCGRRVLEGHSRNFDSLIIAPTSRAHLVIAAAHDADIDNDTISRPGLSPPQVFEALCVPTSENGPGYLTPVLIGCAQDIGMPPDLAASLATRNGPHASTPTIRWRAWGVASVSPPSWIPTSSSTDIRPSPSIFNFILATAWDSLRKDHAWPEKDFPARVRPSTRTQPRWSWMLVPHLLRPHPSLSESDAGLRAFYGAYA